MTGPETQRLEAYEDKTASFMVFLAFAYLVIFSIQVLIFPLPQLLDQAFNFVGWAIWATFIVDLAIRTYLAPNRLDYLIRHPIDVIACAVPALRGLRVLRVLTAGQWLVQRGSRLTLGRTGLAFVMAVIFVSYVGSLAVLDAERGAAGASITNFGDAVWWTFTTMSTVGYGDIYPITFSGRAVAIGLMVVGISILGIVSATLASALIAAIRGGEESDTKKILNKIAALEAEVAALRRGDKER